MGAPTDKDPNSTKEKLKETAASQGEQTTDVPMEEPRMSYREKLAVGSNAFQVEEQWEEDEAEFEDGDIVVYEEPGGTVVELSEAFKSRLERPWRLAVVVKLLGRSIGYRVLIIRLKACGIQPDRTRLWIWLKKELDFQCVLFWGPWMIFNHVLFVHPWTPEFRASKGTIDIAVVWVQFPDIPPNWYHARLLKTLGDLVGRTMKVDIHTSTSSRGKFAKVAVAVDLTKPVKGRIKLEGEIIRVTYEGLPYVCFVCGKVAHGQNSCLTNRHPRSTADTGAISGTNQASSSSARLEPVVALEIKDDREWGKWTTVTTRAYRNVRRGSEGVGNPATPGPTQRMGEILGFWRAI
ncbi:hypothetical protein Tsubulata_045764 [Turnera subulata]|uniref:DUF4283 domain-containing protein n=1 Tax=Turnera subulata TaxID=218843 RepID=A0A9Q0G8J3_9ROSI|nr:hypothetical protein Tsubulata_045764 [Turnera subulata]